MTNIQNYSNGDNIEKFETDIVRLYEQIQEFHRLLPCVSEKNYDNIFLNPANGIDYRTLKKIASKVSINLVLDEDEIKEYELMHVAYNAGALQTEIIKFRALLSHFCTKENLERFLNAYETIITLTDKKVLGSRCKQLIDHFDEVDNIILGQMEYLGNTVNHKEILDIYREFVYFNEDNLLKRYFTTSFESFSLDSLIYAVMEIADISVFVAELYRTNGAVRLSEVDFITMRTISIGGLSFKDFKTNIMGLNKIQMIIKSNSGVYLRSGLYNNYREIIDYCINGTFNAISGAGLLKYAGMVQRETKPLIEYEDRGYDNYESTYDPCRTIMNIKLPSQIPDIVDAVINVTCSNSELIQKTVFGLIHADIRSLLSLVNTAADIVYVHDLYTVTNNGSPMTEFINEHADIVSVIREPMKILEVDPLLHESSVNQNIEKIRGFLKDFNELDLPDIKRHFVGGSESKNAENNEKKLTPDDIYYDLTKVICCHPLLDLASNSLIILSKYIPSKEAFITPCESNVDVKPILQSIKWKDEYAMELLHNTIYEAFNDGVMKNDTNNQGITTGIFNDFMLYSYQTIQLVDMLAKRKMADETPEKRFEKCRNYIVDLFLDHIEKNEIIFLDCKKRSTLRNIIIDEIFLQFSKDIEDNYMINCCTILAVLLNGYINKDYRYGVLKTRLVIALNLYNFIVQNMSEINSELVKK